MDNELLEKLIDNIVNTVIMNRVSIVNEVKENMEVLRVKDPEQFVYGMMMGIIGSRSIILFSLIKGEPSKPEIVAIKNIIFKHAPRIQERIQSMGLNSSSS